MYEVEESSGKEAVLVPREIIKSYLLSSVCALYMAQNISLGFINGLHGRRGKAALFSPRYHEGIAGLARVVQANGKVLGAVHLQ